MKFGAHISIAGGINQAPARAHQLGCECFQIFSRSPRGGPAPELTKDLVKKFKLACQQYNFKEYYIHTPYFINLGSNNKRIYYGSISTVRDELERGSLLDAQYVMTHLGSAKDLGLQKTLKQTIQGICKILEDYEGKTKLLIEIAAGAGKIIGDSFADVAYILQNVPSKVGVCFDTAHAFASGYDLRDKKAVKKTITEFDKSISLKKLKLLHVNDSKSDLASRIDRHEHLGQGKIGLECFKKIITDKRLQSINMILETPAGKDKNKDERVKDIKILKKLRSNQ